MSRFARKRRSNEENEEPREKKPQLERVKEIDGVTQISGRVKCIELENFMCHEKLRVEFDLANNNCFYIGGPNGSGKSALFAAMNIGLGGRGNHNDRGNSVKNYIKEGRRTAKIRITLTNQGQSNHPDYGEYSIVERTINQTSSTYVLKSVDNGKESRISTRKGDLDKLMNRYGIQLVNPIFWMSQDRSRHFLQQMKPEKLFEIFMFATELDSTREFYKELDQVVIDVANVVKRFEYLFAQRKKEIKKVAEHRANLVKLDEKDHFIDIMGWYLLWFPMRDVMVEYAALDERKAHVNKSILEIRDKMEENSQLRADFKFQMEALNKAIGKMSENSSHQALILKEAAAKQKGVENEIRGVHESMNELKRNEKNEEKQIRDIEHEISKREEALLSNGKTNEKVRVERRLREIDHEVSSLEESAREAKDKLTTMKNEYDARSQEKERIGAEKYQSETRLKRAMNDLQESEYVAKDALARFGRDVPTIVQAIKNNLKRFEMEPLGPIGQYMEVVDEGWTVAVESAVGKMLESFVLHSQRDRQTLFDLCRNLRVQFPNVIVTNFKVPPHDTRRNEPSKDIPTIERALKFSNPVIRNCLIDVGNIESIMLIDTDEEAREVLDGRCPMNVRKAFTRSGGNGSGRNQQGGVYRFYPNYETNPRARYLTKKKSYDVQELNAIVNTEKAKVNDLNSRYKTEESAVARMERERGLMGKKINDAANRTNELGGEKRRLERKLQDLLGEETEDTTIAHLKESIIEVRSRIQAIHEERAGYEETRQELEKELVEARKAVKEAKANVEDAQTGSGPLEEELARVKGEMDRRDATHETYIANQRKLAKEVDGFHKQYVELDKKKEKADETAELRKDPVFLAKFAATGGKPAEFSDPPDFESMPPTEETERDYKDKVLEAQAVKAALGGVNWNEEEYRQMVEDYNHNSRSLKKLKKVGRALEKCQAQRREKLPIFRHAVTMRLKMAFNKLMSMRNFGGELRIKHKEKHIEIRVHTQNDNRDSEDEDQRRNATQDLKGLSGGERSYTTACFIMSLWEVMEAPFRCMDEFDVFMDMVNRKVVMELLVKLATEQFAHNQFIFFTPQGIRELGKRDKVQIFEMPKVRD